MGRFSELQIQIPNGHINKKDEMNDMGIRQALKNNGTVSLTQ